MNHKKKALLSLAVAHASMALALDATAADFSVTSGADSGTGTLREAMGFASSGDTITIDADAVSTIGLDSSLTASSKALIISAPVDAAGKPRVTISANSTGFRLLSLDAPGPDPVPFVISGVELSGADVDGPGGAIFAENHALVIDKSVITGNTAVGVGGGVAALGGELCLQGSELSDNTVTAESSGAGQYAIGGGAAVNGILNVVPSSDDYGDSVNCLVSTPAAGLFTSVSSEFADAAADLAGNPEDVDFIPSTVSGNTAEITADVDLEDKKYIALGGGLAVLKSNFDQVDSLFLDTDCTAYFGGKYGGGGDEPERQCTTIAASSVSGNEAKVTTEAGDYEPQYSLVSGGGIFIGTPGVEVGTLLATKYADISDNKVTLTGAGALGHDVVVGAGIGALNSDLPFDVSPFWDSTTGDPECPDGDAKYCGNHVSVGASTVTGNTASIDLDPVLDEGPSLNLIAGGGIGAINLFDSGLDLDKYETAPRVQSIFSSISGNTVDADTTDEFFSAIGGGIAVGTGLVDAPFEVANQFAYGKYFGLFSGNSGNEILVTGANDGAV